MPHTIEQTVARIRDLYLVKGTILAVNKSYRLGIGRVIEILYDTESLGTFQMKSIMHNAKPYTVYFYSKNGHLAQPGRATSLQEEG